MDKILEPSDREAFGKAERAITAVPGQIKQGYAVARKGVAQSFQGAKTAVADQANQAQGDVLQRLQNSGFSGGSSVAANLRMGVGLGTARAFRDIQDRLAQIGTELDLGETRDQVRASGAISDFHMRRGLADRSRNMLHYELLTGARPQAPSQEANDLSGPAKFLAGIL